MLEILQENGTYRLEMEKLQNKWWLTLVEIKTGMAQTLICNTKAIARESLARLTLDQCAAALNRWNVPAIKLYKAK